MKHKLTALLLIILLLSSCTGYQGDVEAETPESPPEEEDNIINDSFGIAYVPEEVMHPLKTRNKLNMELYGLVYEGLFELDEYFVPHPVLCESFYNDGSTYYFTIRSGIALSDGSVLSAADVEHSIKLAMRGESFFAERLRGIEYVKAVDGLRVEVRLSAPNGRLPQLLTFPIVKSKSDNDFFPAGTGCYSVQRNESNLNLFARDNWWRGEPAPYYQIEAFAVENMDEFIYNFESYNIDIITVDSTGTNPIRLRGEYETRDYDTNVMQYIGFNMKNELFSSSLARQAISCLIDRESITMQDFAGLAASALLPLHPRNPAYSEGYAENIKYSVENAKSLLTAANITDSDSDGRLDYGGRRHKPVTVSILVNQENKSKIAVCKRIAETLAHIGITAEVRMEKWEDYVKALNAGDFDIYYAEISLPSDYIIDTLIKRSGGMNYGKFNAPDFENMISSFNAAPIEKDSAALKSFYSEFALRVPFVPVVFKKNTVITHRNFFEALSPTEQNTFYAFYRWK